MAFIRLGSSVRIRPQPHMKTCSKCKAEKPLEEFNFKNKAKGFRQSHCSQCQKAYQKQHYTANKAVYVKRAVDAAPAQRARWRKFIASLNLKCTQCGEDHPAVLDFHHTDPSIKETHPSNMRHSKARFLKEIEKCVVLCSNCHRKLHWDERHNHQ